MHHSRHTKAEKKLLVLKAKERKQKTVNPDLKARSQSYSHLVITDVTRFDANVEER